MNFLANTTASGKPRRTQQESLLKNIAVSKAYNCICYRLHIVYVIRLQTNCICYRTSLVTQLIKYPPAMQETQVLSVGQEDPLEKEMATHSSIFAWKNPMDREAWQAMFHGVANSRMLLNSSTCAYTQTHTHTDTDYYPFSRLLEPTECSKEQFKS